MATVSFNKPLDQSTRSPVQKQQSQTHTQNTLFLSPFPVTRMARGSTPVAYIDFYKKVLQRTHMSLGSGAIGVERVDGD